jgi:hypothetical protein
MQSLKLFLKLSYIIHKYDKNFELRCGHRKNVYYLIYKDSTTIFIKYINNINLNDINFSIWNYDNFLLNDFNFHIHKILIKKRIEQYKDFRKIMQNLC